MPARATRSAAPRSQSARQHDAGGRPDVDGGDPADEPTRQLGRPRLTADATCPAGADYLRAACASGYASQRSATWTSATGSKLYLVFGRQLRPRAGARSSSSTSSRSTARRRRPIWSPTPSRSPASRSSRMVGAGRLLRDPAGGQPGPGRRPHRPAPVQRPARPAHGGHRRGRPGRAGRLVQPDGREPAAAHPAAGGHVAAAAPVHLGRLARAAHPAHHRADGGRPHLQHRARTSTRRSPAAPSCCRPSWTGSRACWPSCSRSAGSTPGSPRSTPSRPTSARWWSGWWSGSAPVAERAGVEVEVDVPAEPGRGRGRRPAGRADPAQPDRQRDRARRGQAGQGTAGRPRGRGGGHRARPRRRASSRARRSWSSTGSGGPTRPGPGRPAAPGSGLSISAEDARLHGGWLEAWGVARAGRPVPPHRAGPGRRPAGLLAAAPGSDRLPPADRGRAGAPHRTATGSADRTPRAAGACAPARNRVRADPEPCGGRERHPWLTVDAPGWL